MQSYYGNTSIVSNLSEENGIVQAIFNQDINEIRKLIWHKLNVNEMDSERRTPLHAAAYVGNIGIIETLILEGAEVNAKDNRWLTPLHRACAKGNYEAVSLLLKNQADVNVRDKLWQSPLHVSAANNSIQCADYLLPHLNNLNFSDRGGHTALHHAALNGHLDMIQLLVKRGANISAYDRQDRRALHWAAFVGETDIIHTLVSNRADINCKDKMSGDTPAHAAAAAGQTNAMRTFLELGFAVDTENAKKNTCLHISCCNGHDEIVQLLLNGAAQVDKRNKFNCTPLHYAAISLHGTLCLELLINKNANPNVQDDMGRTPLHLTAMHGRYGRAETLLSTNARIDVLDNNGNSALHLAARHGHEMLVTALLQAGADPFCKGANGLLPLHLAALHRNVNSCRKLLQAAVSEEVSHLDVISICDADGRSALHHAACSGSLDCVEVFLSYIDQPNLVVALDKDGRMPLHYVMGSASGDCAKRLLGAALQYDGYHRYINHTDRDGRSPLHHASASDENGGCVEVLIERGADVLLTDNSGVSALHYAAAGGHDAAVKLLVDADNNILRNSHLAEQEVPSPLHLASYYGHVNVVNILASDITELDVDISLDVPDSQGRSALELAAYQSNTTCAKTLINYGASPAQKNIYNNFTPLHSAACNGHTKMIQVIIDGMRVREDSYEELSKFINAKDADKCTPLMYCVTNGHTTCVDYLLAQRASLWPVDKFGCTALHRGAVSSYEDILHSLLRHAEGHGYPDEIPADSHIMNNDQCNIINAKSYNGRTALHFAAIRGNSSILESLLLQTEVVNVIDRYGYTPLHYACLEGHEPCVEGLLNHESFYEFMGSTFSPLHCAVFNDNESCADRLLEIMGDDIANLKDRKGRTPLHICAVGDDVDCTKFLLVHQAEIDSTDYKSRTPMMVAIYKGSSNVFEELLKYTSNFSITDYKLNNVLHIACTVEETSVALQLLEHIGHESIDERKELDAQNDQGQTPLHISARKGLTEVVTKLIELGCSLDIDDEEGLTPALACAPNNDVADCLDLLISTMLADVRSNVSATGSTCSSGLTRSSIRESFDSYRTNRDSRASGAQPPKRLSSIYFASSSPKKESSPSSSALSNVGGMPHVASTTESNIQKLTPLAPTGGGGESDNETY